MISLKCQENILFNSGSENVKQYLTCFVQFSFSDQSRGGR